MSYEPYVAPVIRSRGWRVGPTELPVGLAAGDGAGLPLDLSISPTYMVDPAVGDGAGLDLNLTATPLINIDLLPAIGDGAGLDLDLATQVPVALDLATGSGDALLPTLSITFPIGFGAASHGGASDTGTDTWTHTPTASDTFVFVATFFEAADTSALTAFTRTATYDGNAMTSIAVADMGTGIGVRAWVELWKLSLSGIGNAAKSVAIDAYKTSNSTPASWRQGIAASYKCTTVSAGVASNTSGSITIPSASGSVVLVAGANNSPVGAWSANATERRNRTYEALADIPGAASVVATLAGTAPTGLVGCSLS